MGNPENFDDYGWGLHQWESLFGWGIRKTLTISTGDQTKEKHLDLMENKEDSDGFCGELRMKNFDLLGKLKPWGLHWRSENENRQSVGD